MRFIISWNFKDRYFKRLNNDDKKLPAFRVELKIFTRFEFKLVFSGRSMPWDILVTFKCTDIHNFQMLSIRAY